jgi:tetrahydromethanopterin S-methyltransferase subunit F
MTNAILGWATTGILLIATIEQALSGEFLWAGFALGVVAVALVPPLLSRRPREMIAWEVLVLAAIPIILRSLEIDLGLITYLTVAGMALVIAVELDAFTAVEMTPTFAVVFVVIVTMAVAGLWTIAQYVSDIYLGTRFLGDQNSLMWDLVAVTAVGFAAGVLFEMYFRRLSPRRDITRGIWGTD